MTMKAEVRVLLGLCLCAGDLSAQGQERPAVAPPRSFTPPPVEQRTLGNGMRVALVPYGMTPTARVELAIRTGRAFEGAGEAGLAQLVGDYLLEGTTIRSAGAIGERLGALGTVGGGLSVTVGTHETVIAGEVLAESAPELVRLVAEIIIAPAFAAAELERLKTNYRRRVRSQTTSAAAIAAAKVNGILFPEDPADRLASDDQLAALAIADVRSFHGRHAVARRSKLYVAGVFDRAAVAAAAEEAFTAMPTGTAVAAARPGNRADAVEARATPIIHLIDRPGSTQSRLQVSTPIVDQVHPDHLALNQLSSVMGSVQTSRIIANVRERHGYSYNVSARIVRRPAATTWTVQGDVNRDVTAAALREILGELDGLPTKPPSSEELRAFQTFMAGGMMAEMSTARGILDYLRFLDLYGLDLRYLAELVPSIFAIEPTDLMRVYTRYLQPRHRVIVVVGDAASIEPQLRGIGTIVR